MAKQMFVISDDLLRRAVSSCESSLACNEFFDACMASEKSMCENKQRRRWRSASNPNGFTSCKEMGINMLVVIFVVFMCCVKHHH